MTGISPTAGPPPGWHPDPWAPGGLRWWDGVLWSPYAVPGDRWAMPPTLDDITKAQRWSGLAANAFILQALGIAGTAILSPFMWARFSDQLQQSIDHPDQAPTVDITSSLPLYGLSVVSLGAIIVLAIWVHRATKVTRGLGRETKHSPGWAAAGWFIPILNFWYPYEAVRDLVPTEHPLRERLGWWWGCYLAASFAGLLTSLAGLFSVTVALVLAVIPIGLAITAAILGHRIARAVGAWFGEAASAARVAGTAAT